MCLFPVCIPVVAQKDQSQFKGVIVLILDETVADQTLSYQAESNKNPGVALNAFHSLH